MTDTQTIEAINAHLDECPTDWTARLQLADLYEGAGREDEARYQRWAARWGRAPAFDPMYQPSYGRHWYWWRNDNKENRGSLGAQLIEAVLFPKGYSQGGYATRMEAEAELMDALTRLDWPAPELA